MHSSSKLIKMKCSRVLCAWDNTVIFCGVLCGYSCAQFWLHACYKRNNKLRYAVTDIRVLDRMCTFLPLPSSRVLSDCTHNVQVNCILLCKGVSDRLCGLVVRVSGYRYRGLGFDSRRYQIFWVVVDLERGPPASWGQLRSYLNKK